MTENTIDAEFFFKTCKKIIKKEWQHTWDIFSFANFLGKKIFKMSLFIADSVSESNAIFVFNN